MLINVINETKQQIKNVENQLVQLRNFYTENKDKENNYELIKTFFDNIILVQKINSDVFSCFINDENNNYETFLHHYKHNCDYPTVVGFEQKGKEILKIICDEEEMKLIFKIVFLKHKLQYYENLIWQKKIKLVISWLSSLFQRLYTSVIFLIMTVLSMLSAMLTVLILNSIIYQFLNTAVMMSRAQCVHCIQ
jgi:hypothetical protein